MRLNTVLPIALIVAGLPFGEALAAPTAITLGYSITIECLAAFVAKDKGYFDQNGLDVTLTAIPAVESMPAALVSNQLQVGFSNPISMIQAASGGLDVIILAAATHVTTGHDVSAVLVPVDFAGTDAKSLIGKRVAVPGFGGGTDAVFRKWILDNGIRLDQLTLVEASPLNMEDLMVHKQLDAVAIPEPLRSRMIADGVARLLAHFYTDVSPDSLSVVWATSGAWVRDNPAAAMAFRKAIQEANDFIDQHPDQLDPIEKKWMHVTVSTLPVFSEAVTEKDLEFYAGIEKQLGGLQSTPDFTKMIYREPAGK